MGTSDDKGGPGEPHSTTTMQTTTNQEVSPEILAAALAALEEKRNRDAEIEKRKAEAADFQRRVNEFQAEVARLQVEFGVRMVFRAEPPTEAAPGAFVYDTTKVHVGYAPLK